MAVKTTINPTVGRLPKGLTEVYLNDLETDGATGVVIRIWSGLTERGHLDWLKGCVAVFRDSAFQLHEPLDIPYWAVATSMVPYIIGVPPSGGPIVTKGHVVMNIPRLVLPGATLQFFNNLEDDDVNIDLEISYVQ